MLVGEVRRPNSGWWEAQLHLTEELGNCRMKVNGGQFEHGSLAVMEWTVETW